jgi:hypothetical protein
MISPELEDALPWASEAAELLEEAISRIGSPREEDAQYVKRLNAAAHELSMVLEALEKYL